MGRADDGSRIDRCRDFRWSEVPLRAYRGADDGEYPGISRQELTPPAEVSQPAFATRYFEIAAGGASALERHQHPHSVVVLRGHGHVLLESTAHPVGPFDHIYVASATLHQFYAGDEEPLGFLCIVDRERDRPRPASPEEIAGLASDPALAPFVARLARSSQADDD